MFGKEHMCFVGRMAKINTQETVFNGPAPAGDVAAAANREADMFDAILGIDRDNCARCRQRPRIPAG